MFFELFEFLTKMEVGLPIIIAIFAVGGLIYVYNDSKKERLARQLVMDKQNSQWLSLYKENLVESAATRKEISQLHIVVAELQGVIKSIYDLGLKSVS